MDMLKFVEQTYATTWRLEFYHDLDIVKFDFYRRTDICKITMRWTC